MERIKEGERHYGVHMNHCGSGENRRNCKYGEDEICPALADLVPMPDHREVLKVLEYLAKGVESVDPGYRYTNVYRKAMILIEEAYDRYDY